MPQDDTMRSTVRMQWTVTAESVPGPNITLVTNLWWLEADPVWNDTVQVKSVMHTHRIAIGAPRTNITVDYAPDWSDDLRGHISGGEALPNAEFFVRSYRPGAWFADVDSEVIWLKNGTLANGIRRAPRPGTRGVIYGNEIAMAPRLNLPAFASANGYSIYTWRGSDDGTSTQINGFNNSG